MHKNQDWGLPDEQLHIGEPLRGCLKTWKLPGSTSQASLLPLPLAVRTKKGNFKGDFQVSRTN